METIVSIHQPNFYPWLGYFHKIVKADVFIFLDNAQMPKGGGTWLNRVKLLVNRKESWVTAPINRKYQSVQEINQINFDSKSNWRKKMITCLELNYKKHPFFLDIMHVLEPLIGNQEQNVNQYNINAIKEISRHLGIKESKFRSASSFSFESTSNERLCFLTKAVKGSIYLSGNGSSSYLDPSIFEDQNINLKFQSPIKIIYNQKNQEENVTGLSIIDVLMNIGWQEVTNQLKNHTTFAE
jgi:hypothetical protein